MGLAGRGAEGKGLIDAFVASDEGKTNPYWVGCMYAVAGDKEKAFEWLEKSYEMRQSDLISIKVDPALDSLHDDPRYQDLLQRVGLAN